MSRRQTDRELHIGNLVLAVIGTRKLECNSEQCQNEITLVHRLISHVRNTLIGQGVILTLIEKNFLAEGWLGVALSQSRYKGSAAGLDG